MRFGWLKARQTKYTGYVTLYTLVVLAVLGAANYLADQHNASYDSTKNKLYSLSDQTLKVVKGLKEDVSITYFDRSTGFGHARDLFDRYANLSRRLKVVYVDLEQNPQLARTMGVRNLGTIFVQAGAKREEAKSLTEEEVTGALIRSLKTGDRNACFVAGSGERSIDDPDRNGLSSLKEALDKNNYKARAISLIEKPEVPKDCTVLIVAGPRLDYTDSEVGAIRKYVEGGGRALFMLDPPLNVGKQATSE
ncbi:MAG TPA: GldG family protein, partial [Bryobacteraceae bacterium]|nr:GldG family protein [Bryobacteraceae bacterium]